MENHQQQNNNLLEIEAVVGFKGEAQIWIFQGLTYLGDVIDGLRLHPDNEHIIFPLGSTIIIRNIVQRTQTFLRGHDNDITCIAISHSGRYIASGQKTYSGFNADIIVWDFHDHKMLYKLSMHKVRIESLCFSSQDSFLASVGGLDDKNTLIIWDLAHSRNLNKFQETYKRRWKSPVWNILRS